MLHNEVAGIAREMPIPNAALCPRADCTHFSDITEMILNGIATLHAGQARRTCSPQDTAMKEATQGE